MRFHRSSLGSVLLSAACVAACGDDSVSTGSATTSSSTSAADTSAGSSTGGSTGEAPTTGVASTGGDASSGSAVTTEVGTTEAATTAVATTDATTGEATTGEASSSGPGSSGGSSGGACGPGQPGPDADGDTVPDECDVCDKGDDLVDGDGDGVADACDLCLAGDDALDADMDGTADACDECPQDPLDDADNDGVCDSMDICTKGPNNVDVDKDGVPDACDPKVELVFPKAIDDYDVAGDGALVIVRHEGTQVLATCFNGDRSVRRAEFVAGTYDPNQQLGPYPEIHIARQAQKVLVTWFDRAGAPANHRVAYSLLDDKCQPIVTAKTAIAVPDGYFEFHNAAIDAAGNSAVSVSPNATYVNFVDAAGAAKGQQQAFNINAVYGTHVAVNQASGGGILAAQQHSGNGIYYRRFKPDGTWVDGAAVQLPVNYHYWYDGFTVGMNDQSAFVFLWRSGGTTLDMRFFKPDGSLAKNVQRMTIDFEGWNGGHCYDSFRLRHQEIPLRGDDFVLGEVYNWITPQQNRTVHHFQYTPAGDVVVEDSTQINLQEGLTIRVDQLGATYLRGPGGITILADYP